MPAVRSRQLITTRRLHTSTNKNGCMHVTAALPPRLPTACPRLPQQKRSAAQLTAASAAQAVLLIVLGADGLLADRDWTNVAAILYQKIYSNEGGIFLLY